MKSFNSLISNKTKNIFEKIYSDYFLRKLFDNLLKIKTLEIIKYTKNIQKRIKINTNDYKEYSETFSKIEIEIIPVKNKYDKFINIKKDEEKYFHIYFDNNREEIKRNYLRENEKINSIKVIIDYQVKSFEELFLECECIESINFKKFYRNNIINMGKLFFSCKSLKELNISNLKTDNVTDMNGIFCFCSSLKELNISNLKTDKVTKMEGMFYECSSLKELNVSNLNTNNATNMEGMFYGCSSLKELNVSNFNTNNVTNMNSMFYGCKSLKKLNISNFNTNNVTDMKFMFDGCPNHLKKKIRAKYKNIKEEAFGYISILFK